MNREIKVETIVVGPLMTNCYLVSYQNHCIIVDPGAEANRIFERTEGLVIDFVILTHGHADHFTGCGLFQDKGIPIYIGEYDAEMLTDKFKNLSHLYSSPFELSKGGDKFLKHGDKLKFVDLEIEVMHLPGHSMGSIGIYFEGMLFSGDVLFSGSIGRFDLPGGSKEVLTNSIKEKIYNLPDKTIVYPGHGDTTTVLKEKRSNYFVRG